MASCFDPTMLISGRSTVPWASAPASSPALVGSRLSDGSHPDRCEVTSHRGPECTSLMWRCWALLMYLLAVVCLF